MKTDSSAQFIGGVFLSEGCEVGENCIIDASKFRITIQPNCKIGKNTRITAESDKIDIGLRVIIGDNCLITDSIKEDSIIENNQNVLYNHN